MGFVGRHHGKVGVAPVGHNTPLDQILHLTQHALLHEFSYLSTLAKDLLGFLILKLSFRFNFLSIESQFHSFYSLKSRILLIS